MLTYHNLTHINNQVNVISTYYSLSLNLRNLANSAHISADCNNQLRYIQNKLSSIHQDFRIISHQLNLIRQKRGIINGIGNAFKWLFGTPNANDAEFYTSSINQLINNQKQNEVLMQQQVSNHVRNHNKQ